MVNERRPTELKVTDLAYLRRNGILMDRLEAAGAFTTPEVSFEIVDRDLAEEIRDALTERLAQVGFDEKYEATAEGKFLEDLIDRLFMS